MPAYTLGPMNVAIAFGGMTAGVLDDRARFPRPIALLIVGAIAAARDAQEPIRAMRSYLDSVMAFEIVRVEEERPRKRESVVVGFD